MDILVEVVVRERNFSTIHSTLSTCIEIVSSAFRACGNGVNVKLVGLLLTLALTKDNIKPQSTSSGLCNGFLSFQRQDLGSNVMDLEVQDVILRMSVGLIQGILFGGKHQHQLLYCFKCFSGFRCGFRH